MTNVTSQNATNQLIRSINQAERLIDVIQIAGQVCNQLGFDYFSYIYHDYTFFTKKSSSIRGILPIEWLKEYLDNNYIAIDPVLEKAVTTNAPYLWDRRLFANQPHLWSCSVRCGLRYGFSQPVMDHRNASVGVLTFLRGDKPVTEEYLETLHPVAMYLTATVQRKVYTFQDHKVEFTEHEINVMRWTADGKSVAEIAQIYGLNERAVTYTIQTTAQKLGVHNKTAAAVRMATRGYLY
jgi:LuxR family transcriptional regulator, quorum-sensing system regulator SolR